MKRQPKQRKYVVARVNDLKEKGNVSTDEPHALDTDIGIYGSW